MSQAFIDEVRAMHNLICLLYDTDLVRVVGIHFDGTDAYYVTRSMSHFGQEPVDRKSTMVGGCDSMKGVLPRYERTDELFAMNGCPPTETFAVTADTRRQFGEMAGDQALTHYDEDMVPLLLANGGQPDDGGEDPAVEVRQVFATFHPGHADAIRGFLWIGHHNGNDRFVNLAKGGFDFDRTTGAVDSDLDGDGRHDIDAIMRELAA